MIRRLLLLVPLLGALFIAAPANAASSSPAPCQVQALMILSNGGHVVKVTSAGDCPEVSLALWAAPSLSGNPLSSQTLIETDFDGPLQHPEYYLAVTVPTCGYWQLDLAYGPVPKDLTTPYGKRLIADWHGGSEVPCSSTTPPPSSPPVTTPPASSPPVTTAPPTTPPVTTTPAPVPSTAPPVTTPPVVVVSTTQSTTPPSPKPKPTSTNPGGGSGCVGTSCVTPKPKPKPTQPPRPAPKPSPHVAAPPSLPYTGVPTVTLILAAAGLCLVGAALIGTKLSRK